MEITKRCIAATRVHCKNAAAMPGVDSLIKFAESALTYSCQVLFCIGVGDALEHKAYYEAAVAAFGACPHLSQRVALQPISYWGAFTPALNASVAIAAREHFDVIIFQSLEVHVARSDIVALLSHMDEDTLVVGPVLEGHLFSEGEQSLRGRTCPWNTLALWSVPRLCMVGFPLLGDGLGEPAVAGVEEVSAVSFAQQLSPGNHAKLVRLGGVEWNTEHFKEDPERQRYHELKLATKDERPQRQFQRFGIAESGTVNHIIHHR